MPAAFILHISDIATEPTPSNEVRRFFELTDLWKARALQRVARSALDALPPDVVGKQARTVERRLLRDIVPELALRLGMPRHLAGELGDPQLRLADCFEFRERVTTVLGALPRIPAAFMPSLGALSRDAMAGNLVAIALDRVAPPLVESDPLAAAVGQAWAARGVFGRLTWAPTLLADVA